MLKRILVVLCSHLLHVYYLLKTPLLRIPSVAEHLCDDLSLRWSVVWGKEVRRIILENFVSVSEEIHASSFFCTRLRLLPFY